MLVYSCSILYNLKLAAMSLYYLVYSIHFVLADRSALQSLFNVRDIARSQNYFVNGLTHTWMSFYEASIASNQEALNEWNQMDDIESHRATAELSSFS